MIVSERMCDSTVQCNPSRKVVIMRQWTQPKEVMNLDMAFGPKDLKEYLPSWEEIPQVFKDERVEVKKWIQIVDDWFFGGIQHIVATPKVGVDKGIALRHIKTILGSYEPSHEHKTAGVAWLLSLWFDVFEYQKVKK